MGFQNIKTHFVATGSDKRRTLQCKYCSRTIKSKAHIRWASHLHTCSKCPAAVAAEFADKSDPTTVMVMVNSENPTPSDIGIDLVSDDDDHEPLLKRVKSMAAWVDNVDATTNETLTDRYASIFYETGVPFRLANHPAMLRFLQTVRPAFKAPRSTSIATTLLDRAHDKHMGYLNDIIYSANEVVLLTDGWSNVKGDHLVNYVVTFPNLSVPPMLYTTVSTGEESQSGQNIANGISTIIDAIGFQRVTAIVTDNAPNMQFAWRLLEEQYPGLVCNGCGAHVVDLLVRDVCELPENKDVLTKVQEVTAFVRRRTAVLSRFHNLQDKAVRYGDLKSKRGLEFFVDTRWYTHHTSIARLLLNRNVLDQLAASDVVTRLTGKSKALAKAFRATIQDLHFWMEAERLEKILAPTTSAVATLEADSSKLCDVYKTFLGLQTAWQPYESLQRLLDSRWGFVHTEAMGIAFFLALDSKAGSLMVGSDQVDTIQQLKDYCRIKRIAPEQQIVDEIDNYISIFEAPSPKEKSISEKSTRTFWATYRRAKFPALAVVARSLAGIPASQAAAERV